MATLSELEPWLYPYAQYLVDVGRYYGLRIQITSVYRSPEKQQLLWERWKRGQSPIPAAPPGRSKHQHRRAFDLVVDSDYRGSNQAALGRLWQQMGGRWGGTRDPVHFEA